MAHQISAKEGIHTALKCSLLRSEEQVNVKKTLTSLLNEVTILSTHARGSLTHKIIPNGLGNSVCKWSGGNKHLLIRFY